MQNLILQFHEAEITKSNVGVTLIDDNGSSKHESIKSLSKLKNPESAYNLIVILPGQMITAQHVHIQKLSRNQQHNAASYALEDGLAEPIDKQHFAFSVQDSAGNIDALIIKKTRIYWWR